MLTTATADDDGDDDDAASIEMDDNERTHCRTTLGDVPRLFGDVPSPHLGPPLPRILWMGIGEGFGEFPPLQIACRRRRHFLSGEGFRHRSQDEKCRSLSRRQMDSPEKITGGAKWVEGSGTAALRPNRPLHWTAFTRSSSAGSRPSRPHPSPVCPPSPRGGRTNAGTNLAE